MGKVDGKQGPRSDKEWDSARNFNNLMGKSILSMILPGNGYSMCLVSSSVKGGSHLTGLWREIN